MAWGLHSLNRRDMRQKGKHMKTTMSKKQIMRSPSGEKIVLDDETFRKMKEILAKRKASLEKAEKPASASVEVIVDDGDDGDSKSSPLAGCVAGGLVGGVLGLLVGGMIGAYLESSDSSDDNEDQDENEEPESDDEDDSEEFDADEDELEQAQESEAVDA